MEVSPIEILSLMKDNIYNNDKEQSSINIDKNYILQRKYLFSLIQKISKKIGFKSQTFFVAINYLDIIFSKNIDIIYNYSLLAMGCLIIASKFCENVPLRPIFKHFVNLYNNELKDDNCKITKEDLFQYEIIICKMLDYKLNYYTIYDFNFFFFCNGIIKIEQLKKLNYDIIALNLNEEINPNISSTNISKSSSQIKKILIKIYERSRHYLDIIIENLICLKYNSLLISICIMEKSIDFVLLNENKALSGNKSINNINEIALKNKEYFKQIMKDFYKISIESLPEYEDLKVECNNYKLFDDIYDKDRNKNKDNINLIKIKKNNGNLKLFAENDSFSKNLKIIKDVAYKQPPTIRNNEAKDKFNFLYKKANVQVFPQKSNIKKKCSPKKRTSVSNFKEKINNNNNHYNNSKIIITSNDFYRKHKEIYRNSTSNNKNNYYLKKSNTSSSPFKRISQFNTTNNKSNIINKTKLKSKNRLENSEEGLLIDNIDSNSNSIDAKIYDLKDSDNKISINKNNIFKITKPYIKKVIQNYEKNDDKKNININININNKILYSRSLRHKDRTKSSKKDMISKYLNQSNCSMIRGKSIINKSYLEKYNQKPKNNLDSSPIYEKNITNYNYIPFKFNKKDFNQNDISINQYNYNLIYQDSDNNELDSNSQSNKVYKTNYNIYNTSLTSRNSYQYPKHNSKLTDSFANVKMVNLKKEKEYDKANVNNYNSLNFLKNKNNLFQKRNNENLNKTNNNSIYESNNYIESYKNKKSKMFNFQNDTSNSININFDDDINEKENNMEINNNNCDARQKNFSNVNINDYSTGFSNEKSLY